MCCACPATHPPRPLPSSAKTSARDVCRSSSFAQRPPATGNDWDGLRRESRKLETDLGVRLAAFGKLCSGLDTTYGNTRGESGLGIDQLTYSKSLEIEDLLKQMSDVNGRLSSCVSGGSDPRAPLLSRHRGVLEDYSHEFSRLSESLGTARDRAQLFEGGTSGGLSQAIGEVLGQANAVSSQLTSQRELFVGLDSKMKSLSAKFPALSGVMNAIRRKKSKDTIILSGVILVCTVFTVLYWWSK